MDDYLEPEDLKDMESLNGLDELISSLKGQKVAYEKRNALVEVLNTRIVDDMYLVSFRIRSLSNSQLLSKRRMIYPSDMDELLYGFRDHISSFAKDTKRRSYS